MLRFILIVWSILIVSNPPCINSQSLNTVAVLDFQNTGGMGTGDVKSLTNRFRGLLVDSRSFIVVEREKMNEILKEQDFAMSDNCNTSECVVKVGELLGVQKMIAGSLGKVGQTHVIDIRLIDVSTGSIIKAIRRDHKGEADDLLSTMEEIVAELTGSVINNPVVQKTGISMPQEDSKPAFSAYCEGLGIGGMYSLNADYRITPHIALRAGFTKWSFNWAFFDTKITGFPIGISYLTGRRHSAEIGLNCLFYSEKSTDVFFSETNKGNGTLYAGSIGYRYQPEEGGLIFRATLYPTSYFVGDKNVGPKLLFGVSVGFTMDSRSRGIR